MVFFFLLLILLLFLLLSNGTMTAWKYAYQWFDRIPPSFLMVERCVHYLMSYNGQWTLEIHVVVWANAHTHLLSTDINGVWEMGKKGKYIYCQSQCTIAWNFNSPHRLLNKFEKKKQQQQPNSKKREHIKEQMFAYLSLYIHIGIRFRKINGHLKCANA